MILICQAGGSGSGVTHVANVENRIRFKEAQLIPKKAAGDATAPGEDADVDEYQAETSDNPGIVSKLLNTQSNSRRRGRYKPRKPNEPREESREESVMQEREVSQDVAMEIDT